MGKNNMTGRKSNTLRCFLIIICYIFVLCASGQDKLPFASKTNRPSVLPEEAKDYRQPQAPVALTNSMPGSFKNTKENVLVDTMHILIPFFEKLRLRRTPVRIVHMGDSHIRGHVLSLVVRRNFERDFGDGATYPDTITYLSSGLARETGLPGVVYHMIGINGATCTSFTNAMQINEIAELTPDLIIISLGTNESHGRGYLPSIHERQMDELFGMLRKACPDAAFLLTTPPGSYIRYRRRRSINMRTPLVATTIKDYAKKHGYAAWDLYNIIGGREYACLNWISGNYMVRDRVHYTVAGYTLQGNLLYEALIKAYNDYVSN